MEINKTTLKRWLSQHEGQEAIVWDAGDGSVKGFGVRLKPSGAASYVVQYRNNNGRSRRYTLGSITEMHPTKARDAAAQAKRDGKAGKDHGDKRRADRKALTVSQLCDDYLAASQGHLKPSTIGSDRGRIECHIKPLLGTRIVETLKKSDVERFVLDVMNGKTAKAATAKSKTVRGSLPSGGPGAASRSAGLLRTILERAVGDGILAFNPAAKVKRPKETARDQPFSFDRIRSVGQAMREMAAAQQAELGQLRQHTPTVMRAVRFLILTGCRRSEALTLRWGDVDFASRCLRLRDTKTGKQVRPVGGAALDVLADFKPRNANSENYVFPGQTAGSHYAGHHHGMG